MIRVVAEQEDLGSISALSCCFSSPQVLGDKEKTENQSIETCLVPVHSDKSNINLSWAALSDSRRKYVQSEIIKFLLEILVFIGTTCWAFRGIFCHPIQNLHRMETP